MSRPLTQIESELLTLFIEGAVAFAFKRRWSAFAAIGRPKYYAAVCGATVLSHPLLWSLALAGGPVPILEIAVVVFEALVLAVAWRQWKVEVLVLSLVMNATSYGFGVLYYAMVQ
ncbi:MAG: hypothetical protein JST04_12150 [Bdellovibrionales bacterium]|nr:hypothetical protein [Bdellovibrionales bacterium]